jgi:hypothetical protein
MTPLLVLRPWLDMAALRIWSTSLLSATGFFSPGIRFRFWVTDLPPLVCATYALSYQARSNVWRGVHLVQHRQQCDGKQPRVKSSVLSPHAADVPGYAPCL